MFWRCPWVLPTAHPFAHPGSGYAALRCHSGPDPLDFEHLLWAIGMDRDCFSLPLRYRLRMLSIPHPRREDSKREDSKSFEQEQEWGQREFWTRARKKKVRVKEQVARGIITTLIYIWKFRMKSKIQVMHWLQRSQISIDNKIKIIYDPSRGRTATKFLRL